MTIERVRANAMWKGTLKQKHSVENCLHDQKRELSKGHCSSFTCRKPSLLFAHSSLLPSCHYSHHSSSMMITTKESIYKQIQISKHNVFYWIWDLWENVQKQEQRKLSIYLRLWKGLQKKARWSNKRQDRAVKGRDNMNMATYAKKMLGTDFAYRCLVDTSSQNMQLKPKELGLVKPFVVFYLNWITTQS